MAMAGPGQSFLEKSPIESICITGSKINQTVSTGKIVIAMKKKDENSLVVLSQASDEMSGQ
jgi:methyl coenzyme M reductase subunit D